MTRRELAAAGAEALRSSGIPSADLDAEVLLAATLRTTKEDLLANDDRIVSPLRERRFRSLIERRARHEPVAYLTGVKEFFGRPFAVSPDVLIPRPESELCVELALRFLPRHQPATVADVGTGSGCLAVSLLLERPALRVLATDLSQGALRMARENARRYGVVSRLRLLHGNFMEPLQNTRVDLIVANLPYVPHAEVMANPDLQYEPIIALSGQLGPDKTLRAFLDQWYARQQRPTALVEIHPNQEEGILRERANMGVDVRIEKDLAGRSRVAVLSYRQSDGR